MKRVAVAVVLQILVLTAHAAETPKECSLCVGAVSDLVTPPSAVVPLIVETTLDNLATTGAGLDALTPEQRKQTTVVVRYGPGEGDPLLGIEQRTKTIVDWARTRGPFDGFGVLLEGTDPVTSAYAIKRFAVTVQGLDIASRIVLPLTSLESLQKLYDNGAQGYFDALLVDAPAIADTARWLTENDPAKKIFAVVEPTSPNQLFDLATALARGATRAYMRGEFDAAALANANRAFIGDFVVDPSAKTSIMDAKGNQIEMPVVTFVRGEDLRTIVVPQGDAAASAIVAMASEDFARPRRVDAAGEREVTDTGRRGGRFLIGFPPTKRPFLMAVDHAERPRPNVTREAMDVATQRGITVEEIIRNHQAHEAFQESIEPRYIARNTTKLRFAVGDGGDAVEAAISGDYFSEPEGKADWVWAEFYINGVKWKYGRIPELPLIQPERVTQLPLDIHLSNEYRYELVRETDMRGYRTYEVRFEPPRKAPENLPLYRGTVWIDTRTWARIRIAMVQLNLTGEVLSNEERVDFQPFARDTNAILTPADVAAREGRSVRWLPQQVEAQQVVSAAGRANVILRSTTFTNFEIDPPDFAARHAQVSASESRMVRETEEGLRYLEKRGSGERVVKEGFDTAQLFMLGGVHHDAGLEYPVVPLGGIDYFNFNLFNKGIQTNVFFAGVVIAANATHPNVANTRTNVGADLFAIALPVENTIYRHGEEEPAESIRSLPFNLALRAGHPVFQFGKVDVSLGLGRLSFRKTEDKTADDFVLPSNTFVITPSIQASYARWGYNLGGYYDWSRRTSWEPWGNLAEYDEDQKSYTRYGVSFGKSFYLPKFQRISVDVNYLGGKRLDRFSKYELGFFGAQRVHGIKSGSVRAEKAVLGHVSYGFVFSQQFRLEAFYDHALLDDAAAGYRREPFQGLGIAGQTVGPYGTLVRLDIGKTIGRNAQEGFVANVVFLKLF